MWFLERNQKCRSLRVLVFIWRVIMRLNAFDTYFVNMLKNYTRPQSPLISTSIEEGSFFRAQNQVFQKIPFLRRFSFIPKCVEQTNFSKESSRSLRVIKKFWNNFHSCNTWNPEVSKREIAKAELRWRFLSEPTWVLKSIYNSIISKCPKLLSGFHASTDMIVTCLETHQNSVLL